MKRFLPLIVISLLTILFAFGHTWWLSGDSHVFMQYLMAGYFLIFGALKVSNWPAFVRSYRKYDWLAARSSAYAWAYPALEIILGVFYYLALWSFFLNLFVLVLMLEKAVSVYTAIKTKKISRCACLGGWFSIPITYVTVFEDLLMASMALWMITHFAG
jgi:hypothetical protein